MAIEVFNRREKKYLLSKKQYLGIMAMIQERMEYDTYNKGGEVYKICNIYYDTPNHDLIRKSISKPVYKEKIRVRGYGEVALGDKVFVELKKKYKGVVNKRRTAMKLEDALWYLDGKIGMAEVIAKNPGVNRQVLAELDYFKKINPIRPMVYLSYERMAYVAKEDKNFRVTFDTNITSRRKDVELHKGSFGRRLLPEDVYLMEVKIPGAVPLWFARCLSQLKVYPTSFSKYGTEYMRYLQENKGEEICLNQFLQAQQQITQLILAGRLSELA
ncbi:MAG: polyphosphate polymerase domain-containing protein [Lachnospira sp.]|nr:polyphosphate polymerase domain-containing protein [Lachnospira sp.]